MKADYETLCDGNMSVIVVYGNTNTFFVRGTNGGLLIDTDSAGTDLLANLWIWAGIFFATWV